MDATKQRIAIAEACGFVAPFSTATEKWSDEGGGGYAEITRDSRGRELPDYLNDLNACREMEKVLSTIRPPATQDNPNPKSQIEQYRETLCIVTLMDGGPISARAAQRAEAFLKTLNLWHPATPPPPPSAQGMGKDES